MKYFKINTKPFYGDRIASCANGSNVPNNESFFDRMRKGEILYNTPIFDYFILESFDDKKYWEWSLFDVCEGIGDYPGSSNWYISENLKICLENFKISPKYHFYETRLLYKGEKLKYWIFQFVAIYRKLNKMEYIDFPSSCFSLNDQEFIFNSFDEWSHKNEMIYEKYNLDLKLKKVYFNHFFDFIPLNPISSDNIISEKLKQAIEENGITGFEFSELDYEVEIAK